MNTIKSEVLNFVAHDPHILRKIERTEEQDYQGLIAGLVDSLLLIGQEESSTTFLLSVPEESDLPYTQLKEELQELRALRDMGFELLFRLRELADHPEKGGETLQP